MIYLVIVLFVICLDLYFIFIFYLFVCLFLFVQIFLLPLHLFFCTLSVELSVRLFLSVSFPQFHSIEANNTRLFHRFDSLCILLDRCYFCPAHILLSPLPMYHCNLFLSRENTSHSWTILCTYAPTPQKDGEKTRKVKI